MKSALLLLTFGFLLACSEKQPQASTPENIVETNSAPASDLPIPVIEERTDSSELKAETIPVSEAIPDSADIFLDRAHYFQSTQEFYVSLRFNDGYSYEHFSDIQRKMDSVVFTDMGITRTRLPMEWARVYFDLDLLDSIRIYDAENLVQKSQLKRVEFFDYQIETEFIAVFEGNAIERNRDFYAVGGSFPIDENFQFSYLPEQIAIIEQTKEDHQMASGHHLISSAVELTSLALKLISFADLEYDHSEVSYLLEVDGDSSRILLTKEAEYAIQKLIPTALIFNHRPILLLEIIIPDTDARWFSPAVYDGNKYQLTSSKIYLDPFRLTADSEEEEVPIPHPDSIRVFQQLKENPYDFDTLLSGGYYLKHKVFRGDLRDFVQTLTLMEGDREVREFGYHSLGLLYKNIGYIGADFGNSFVMVYSYGSGNPSHIELIVKETGEELIKGLWVDADEAEQVLLYLDDRELLMLYDLANDNERHITDFDSTRCVTEVIGGLWNCVQIDSATAEVITLKSEYEEEIITKQYSRR